jgi:predicted phosphodiesterase
MKVIKRDLGVEFKSIKVLALSDFHIGDSLCNLKLIRQVLEDVKNSPNTFIILNGDLMNNGIKNSVSSVYDEELTPTEQILRLCDLLEPVKDRILVIHPGNHEWRTYKEDGVDIIRLVARQLGIEDRFSDGWWYLYLTFGLNEKKRDRPMMYTITGVHGYGGGRKNGGKINNLVEMSDKVIADVYVMGHTHTPIMTRNSIFMPDYQHKTLVQKDKYYLMTNSFLEYGGYGEQYGFTPSTNEHQEMILDGTKKLIKIIM